MLVWVCFALMQGHRPVQWSEVFDHFKNNLTKETIVCLFFLLKRKTSNHSRPSIYRAAVCVHGHSTRFDLPRPLRVRCRANHPQVHIWKSVTNVTEVVAAGYQTLVNVGYDKLSWYLDNLQVQWDAV